jgi:RHS repeat-associated protein
VTSANGDLTEYVYGADGTRLKRIVTEAGVTTTSLYLGDIEIVNPAAGAASSEIVNWHPHPNVKIANTRSAGATTTYLHRNQLGSVVLIADASGGQDIERIYEPFGADAEYILDVTAANDDIGFIGERKDAVAGLQYLNARYYDPELAMFVQPDWWEVTRAGVGTNRYAYSGNDPVNLRDPGGNNFDGLTKFTVPGSRSKFGGLLGLGGGGVWGGSSSSSPGLSLGRLLSAIGKAVSEGIFGEDNVSSKSGDSDSNSGESSSSSGSGGGSPDPGDDDEETSNKSKPKNAKNTFQDVLKVLNLTVRDFHRKVKPEILTDFRTELRNTGVKNPDIAMNPNGNIIFRDPVSKRTILETSVPMSSYGY